MRRLARPLAVASIAVLGLLTVSACDGHTHKQGPSGVVIARRSSLDCHTGNGGHRSCVTSYFLTTHNVVSATTTEFSASKGDYTKCTYKESYPSCVR